MQVRNISLLNFKNHPERQFELSRQINCFVGNNGAGKTNVLDALHYLSVGKSFLGTSDTQNITRGSEHFTIQALIEEEEREHLLNVHQAQDGKKHIRKNGKLYTRISEHIGFLPSVMISPYDSNLISDSGESRRRFMDGMISQVDSQYLHDLIQYQKILKQRNALLKYFQRNRTFQLESLEIYDEPWARLAANIFQVRRDFIQTITPIVQYYYSVLSLGKEEIAMEYHSHLHDTDPMHLLRNNLEKDRMLSYTGQGIHKDDLWFGLDGYPLKKSGSQGQQKSFLIALKLAQTEHLTKHAGKKPILLLDDIFDKLDESRVTQLIQLVNAQDFGQMFITDTHKERTENIVKRINEESKVFEI